MVDPEVHLCVLDGDPGGTRIKDRALLSHDLSDDKILHHRKLTSPPHTLTSHVQSMGAHLSGDVTDGKGGRGCGGVGLRCGGV